MKLTTKLNYLDLGGNIQNDPGTTDYLELTNKPSINGNVLEGDIILGVLTEEEKDKIAKSIERVELECADDQNITVKGTTESLTYSQIKNLVDNPELFVTLKYLDMWWMLPAYDDGGAIMFTSSDIEAGHTITTRVIINEEGQTNNYSIISEDVDHKTDDLTKEVAIDNHLTYPTTHSVNVKFLDIDQNIGNLSDLSTQDKSSIVDAINEVQQNLGTTNYNDLDDKPSINGTVLTGDLTFAVMTPEQQEGLEEALQLQGKVTDLDNKVSKSEETLTEIQENISYVRKITDDLEFDNLPNLCGQPMMLFGSGTPQEAIVPINWKQYDPETQTGYQWNGLPSALGQVYINTSVTVNGRYTAIPNGFGNLKWVNF